jgi:hypothetical protein
LKPLIDSIEFTSKHQQHICGGFFVVNKTMLNWWHETFYNELDECISSKTIVKDNQYVILRCYLKHPSFFNLWFENKTKYDQWFMFTRLLNDSC